MTYSPSPRPTFDGPAHIPFQSVTRHLWGDVTSGEVADWIYVSSSEIHQLVFGLPVGGKFLHSDKYRTVFAADEVLHVLSGVMVIANPETGEVHRVQPGESVFFRRDTWHHCFNHGRDPLRVLEFFAPPPSQGTSGAYAQTKPILTEATYRQDHWLGRWPMERQEAQRGATMQVIREADLLWRLEAGNQPVLTGLIASTEHITVGLTTLLPGQRSEAECHDGEEGLYLLQGVLNVRILKVGGQQWYELHPGDGFYVPRGVRHQYYNMTADDAQFIFGVAPDYLAPSS
jgi:quercetin dioxygenase-like cupin family protein